MKWLKKTCRAQLNLEEVKRYWGRGNQKGKLHIQCKWRMLPRISGGRTPCFLLRQFFIGCIESTVPSEGTTRNYPSRAVSPSLYTVPALSSRTEVIFRGVPCPILFLPASSSLCSLWALLVLLWQLAPAEWGVAEVRLNIALYFAVQVHPRTVPISCNFQHTHLLLWPGKWNSKIIAWCPQAMLDQISTRGVKCCCQPKYAVAWIEASTGGSFSSIAFFLVL